MYNLAMRELTRPHSFAGERVGFFSAKPGIISENHHLIFLTDYFPVPDDGYLRDPYSGARINSSAIRSVLQRILDTGEGAFHAHLHDHWGKPGFSRMDSREIPAILKSFKVIGPAATHGMLLFSKNHIVGRSLIPNNSKFQNISKFSILGYPLIKIRN